MRANSSGQRRLTNQVEDCGTPAWSPNGRWIVSSCELGYWKLALMRAVRRAEAASGLSAYRIRADLGTGERDHLRARRGDRGRARDLRRPRRWEGPATAAR
jgi:hypothetical protein